jgi:hypothetical protein
MDPCENLTPDGLKECRTTLKDDDTVFSKIICSVILMFIIAQDIYQQYLSALMLFRTNHTFMSMCCNPFDFLALIFLGVLVFV